MASENDTTTDTPTDTTGATHPSGATDLPTMAGDAGVVPEGSGPSDSAAVAPLDAPPVKKAARKRAPRKAAAPTTEPREPATDATAEPSADPTAPTADSGIAPRKTARKAAAKKTATKATAAKTTRSRAKAVAPEAPGSPAGPDAPSAADGAAEAADASLVDLDALDLAPLDTAPLDTAPLDTAPLDIAAPVAPADRATADADEPSAVATPGSPTADLGAVFRAPVTPRRRAAATSSASSSSAPARRSRRSTSAAAAPAPAAVDPTAGVGPASSNSASDSEADNTELLTAEELTQQADATPATDNQADTAARNGEADADSENESDSESDSESDGTSDAPRRRRRRGGKGRRGRGSSQGDSGPGQARAKAADEEDTAAGLDGSDGSDGSDGAGSDGPADAAPAQDGAQETAGAVSTDASHDSGSGGPDSSDTDGEGTSTGSRRRTRRRRRSGGGDAEDTPGVTTRVREPREPRAPRESRESRNDEVTALKGSTRLEAKKQRRREGREAGRRRTVITEAEFLARRESVERVMVVRHVGDRTQIGVLEDDVLVEHYISKETSVSMAGNIYLGRVQNVLPSMEAAFVDIGKGRNAVLYAGEVNWDAAGLANNQAKRIENALSSGESVLVQVTKDPIGHKGARLTSQISLPGRYLVYVPNSSMTGISRKLPDTERARLKKILKEVVPSSAGVIVRTAAEGASEEELRADVERLTTTWDEIVAKAESAGGSGKKGKGKGSAPVLLHGEPDLTVRVIRDIFNEDFASLVVAGEQAWQEVSEYVGSVAPDLAERVTRWTSEGDLFSHYRVDEQIAKAMDRKVYLPSGGSLVIDRTEAMTVVDVNTGKFIGSGGNLEETVTKNNIEAAEEIVRQLRLRDVGGIIVIDFIDMVLESNRDLVVRRLLECLGRDRTKHQVAEVTSLGLVQMTRKRVGSGLIEVFSETCEHCAGRGFIIHTDPVDRSNGDDHAHGANGGNGTNAGHGGNGPRQSSRRGSGSGSSGSFDLSNTAPQQRHAPTGPTPAQIAAAAHAAALKTAEQAVAEVLADAGMPDDLAVPVVEDLLEIVELDLPDGPSADSEQAEPTEPAEIIEPAERAEPQTVAEPEVEVGPEVEAEVEPEPEQAYVPPVATPIAAPRRRRGRVVAPAGPPRGSDASS